MPKLNVLDTQYIGKKENKPVQKGKCTGFWNSQKIGNNRICLAGGGGAKENFE